MVTLVAQLVRACPLQGGRRFESFQVYSAKLPTNQLVMKTFELEVSEFIITKEKAEFTLSEPVSDLNLNPMWELMVASGVNEFHLRHSENIDFAAEFNGFTDKCSRLANGCLSLQVSLVRPA